MNAKPAIQHHLRQFSGCPNPLLSPTVYLSSSNSLYWSRVFGDRWPTHHIWACGILQKETVSVVVHHMAHLRSLMQRIGAWRSVWSCRGRGGQRRTPYITTVGGRQMSWTGYTAKIGFLLYKCSYILCAVYGLVYVWPTFNEEINM